MSNKPISPDWVVIMGQSFHKLELLKFVIFALLLFILASGIGAYFLYDYITVSQEEERLHQQHIASTGEATTPDDPVEAFLERHFETTRFNEVNSIRAIGTYNADGKQFAIELLAKQPLYYKQVIRVGERVLEVGFDGEQLWYEESKRILNTDDPEYMKLTQALAMLECAIPCLAWEYENGLLNEEPEVLKDFMILQETEWDGRDCIVVKNLRLLEGPVYHYIDKETGLEVYRRTLLQLSERRQKEVELYYAPPLEGLEYPVPGGFDVWVDGMLIFNVVFDRIEFNRGLASYLFKQATEN